MKFTVITHTPHFKKDKLWYAYGPYINEMNIWANHVNEVCVVAPVSRDKISHIQSPYKSATISLSKIPAISFVSFSESIKALLNLPLLKFRIFNAMRKADHIHLRCPGTIGLVGCFMQILFPKKPKTAKYAGNWDPKARQPLSYRLQKWILSSTFLTKNMQVLVYGEWPRQSGNIKPFFTATYPKSKIESLVSKSFTQPFQFLFVGTLSPGKRPLYVVKLTEALARKGIRCRLDMYGDGSEREAIESYVQQQDLDEVVTLHGNQPSGMVETAYKQGHLLFLPSKSEGWPKVVAEAMFWGVIPVATRISCVSWMMAQGERGILLEGVFEEDMETLCDELKRTDRLQQKSKRAQEWSQHYTLDYFESEIKKLLS